MREDIENLIVHYSSIPIAILMCGSIMPEVMAPIQVTVSRIYNGINPRVRSSIERVALKAYENARMTYESVKKTLEVNKFGPLYLFA
jgi:hypothetical protein